MYPAFKAKVLGKVIGDGQCVALIVNNSNAYTEFLWPGVTWTNIFAPVPSAKDLFTDANPKYFQAIANNHNDPNQVPLQGDVMVFGPTPAPGFSNTFNNPDGHAGICDSASSAGYALLQQNSPSSGSPVNVKQYPWKFRPCIGWLRPVAQAEYYTVVKGDTMSGIAVKFGLTLAQLEALNPQVTNPNLISIGEKIRVK